MIVIFEAIIECHMWDCSSIPWYRTLNHFVLRSNQFKCSLNIRFDRNLQFEVGTTLRYARQDVIFEVTIKCITHDIVLIFLDVKH